MLSMLLLTLKAGTLINLLLCQHKQAVALNYMNKEGKIKQAVL